MRPALKRSRWLRTAATYLLLGAACAVAEAFVLWLLLDPLSAASVTADTAGLDGIWNVTRYERGGAVFFVSVRDWDTKRSWGAEQAVGPPDAPGYGDLRTAWASRTPDGEKEWLLLSYERPIAAAKIQVHCTYNPGAIEKITAFAPDGREVIVWEGRDPTPTHPARRVFETPAELPFETERIKVYLDSPRVGGWNEIDAVGVVDRAGKTWWAAAAEASSSYADTSASRPAGGVLGPAELIPNWSSLRAPTVDYVNYTLRKEERVGGAFGWPWLALGGASGPLPMSARYAPTASGNGIFFHATAGHLLVPYRPLWPGFLLNTLCFSAALWVLVRILTRPWRVMRELLRMRRGQCPRCGYDLRFDFARGCPECGFLREDAAGDSAIG